MMRQAAGVDDLREQQLADWPPAVIEHVHGWRLRSTPGVRRHRSNSALPPTVGALDHLEEVLARGPLAVQVFEGQEALDAELARRGWSAEKDSDVMAGHVSPGPMTGVVERFDAAWLDVHRAVEGRDDVEATVREVFARLGARARYLQVPGKAIALAIDSPAYVGVFSIATLPGERGRGHATALLRAAGLPGRTTYLQVTATNPAVALYARLGLRRVSGYHYRARPRRSA